MSADYSSSAASALKALEKEFNKLQEEPVEGFRLRLLNVDNLFDWEVAIFGPPDTLYQGGYFKAHMRFPQDYPYSPPTLRFKSQILHPNVYENGDLCISILHPPVDDPGSGELVCERWNPTQNVRTILLSVVSLLNEPNTSSPANVDASVLYLRFKQSKGNDKEYENIIKNQVALSKAEAERDGVIVPTTLKDYIATAKPPEKPLDPTDFYDDDYDLEDDDSTQNCDADSGIGDLSHNASLN